MRRSVAAVAVLAVMAAGCGAEKRGREADAEPDKPRPTGLSWAYERIDDGNGELVDGAAMAPDDIWALGSDGVGADGRLVKGHLLHFDGEKWSRKPMPVAGVPGVSRMESLGSAGIWLSTVEGTAAAPENARYALWDGTRWGPVRNAPTGPLTDVEVIAPDDVWVLQGDGTVTHWDGSRWAVTPMPAKKVVALAGSARDDVWAVGSRTTGPGIGGAGGQVSQPAAMHFDGEKWTLTKTGTFRFSAPVPPEPFAAFREIDVASKTYARVSGDHSFKGYDAEENPDPRPSSFTLRWDGSRWTRDKPFSGACEYRRPVMRDGDGGFFMDGNWHLAADGTCTKIKKPRLPNAGGVRPESQQQLWLQRIVPVPGTDKVIGFGTVDVLQSGAPASKAVVVTLKR